MLNSCESSWQGNPDEVPALAGFFPRRLNLLTAANGCLFLVSFFYAFQDVSLVVPSAKIYYILFSVLIAIALLKNFAHPNPGTIRFQSTHFAFFALLWLWMLCSVFWSPLPKLSMYYVFKYFCFFAFALSTVTMYAHHPERLRAVVLKGLAIGGFTIVGRYLVEFVRGGGLAILTHPTTSEFFTEMCAFSANFGGGKNLLGSWMSFNITFTVPLLILCLNCRKTAYLLLIAAVPIFVLTFTRTAVLGLAFFIVCVPLFMKRREIRSIVRLLPLRTIVLLGLLFIVLNPLDVRAKFTQRMIYPLLYYQGKTTDLGAEGRHTLWTGAWRTIQENPILGTGIGTLGDGRIQYPEDNFHNVYLQIVAQTGMVGLLLFTAWSFVLFAMAAALSRSLPHRDFRDVLFGRLLLLNLATYYFKSLFMFQYFDLEIWTLIIFISCHYYYVLHTHVTPSGCHTLP